MSNRDDIVTVRPATQPIVKITENGVTRMVDGRELRIPQDLIDELR